MSTIAIIVAAGAGLRMGASVPKALMPLGDRPLLLWSLDAMRACARVDGVIVVAPPGREQSIRALVAGPGPEVIVVPGGASRSESVREGLRATPPHLDRVIVHDAARPLVSAALIDALLNALSGADGAIAAAPVVDTLKRGDGDLFISGTVAREGLWAAQTPQAFRAASLRQAVAAAEEAGTLAATTDCASIVEAWGGRVRLVASNAPNPKVTTAADLPVAEALLGVRAPE